MAINTRNLEFVVKGPYRHSDGSYKFDVVIFEPASVMGGVAEIRGQLSVHVDTDNVCRAAGEALKHIADQLPPELALVGRN